MNNKFFFLTKSLDPLTISKNNIDTSSKKFEIGLISALSEKYNLEVIYIGKIINDKIDKIDNNIKYKCINHYSIHGFISLLKYITHQNKLIDSNIIITSAYYPLLSFLLLLSKLLGSNVYSYIYDTHKSATEKMGKIKKTCVNIYFFIGFKMAQRFNGFFVLNDMFIKKMKIKTPYIKTLIGIDFEKNHMNKNFLEDKTNKQKVICFAGTLNEDNGVKILLDAFKKDKKLNYQLHFYGYGDLENDIVALSKYDNRIVFYGNTPQETLKSKLLKVDYLINLRNPNALSSDYAFPSKFIEYLATGKPVISNIFPALEKVYIPYIICVQSFDKEGIIRCLKDIDDISMEKRRELVSMLKKDNSWDSIVDKIILFIKKDINV